jgi:hypothetical protein
MSLLKLLLAAKSLRRLIVALVTNALMLRCRLLSLVLKATIRIQKVKLLAHLALLQSTAPTKE